jgi:prepilin-type N-terminal cleavage/methylation domain-containing protein
MCLKADHKYYVMINSPKNGFTLIELMVVISIITLLSTIVLASVSSVRVKAQVAAGQLFSSNIHSAMGANIVGQWDFNSMSSNTVIDEAYGNNGTVTNGSLSSDSPIKNGNSISLTGSASQVAIANSTNYRFGTGDFTFAFWVKHNALTASNTYFENGSWGDNTIILRQDNPSTLYVWVYSVPSGCGHAYTYSFAPRTGQWYHMAVTRESGTMRVYINGAQLGGDISMTCDISPTQQLKIGSSVHTTGQLVNGLFDNFRIYNKSLRSAEVQRLFALGRY